MATLTITISNPDAVRVATAFGAYLNLKDGSNNPRDATNAEVKAAVIDGIKSIVREQERIKAAATANATPVDPT